MTTKILILTLAIGLLTACSTDDADSQQSEEGRQEEILLKTDVRQVMEGTRAATFDNKAGLQTEAQFTCVAYQANTTTVYIPTTTVDWISSDQWAFNNGTDHYYWPETGNLDFFAYMPVAAPSYITAGPTYTASTDPETHNVTFTCSGLPMTNTGQDSSLKEFMFGMALAQNSGNASSGVPLTFQHPFARIKLQLSASHPDIKIYSIKFKSIYNNGRYDHSASTKWTTSGTATDFVLTLTGTARIFNSKPSSPQQQIGEYYIMIPQDWAGDIEVNADCQFWGETKNYPNLTTTVPTTWQPGYSYTYTFTISPDDLKVDITELFTEQW